jgi:two-component system, NtrC family, response regulator HydG
MNLQIAIIFTNKISQEIITQQDANLLEYFALNKLKSPAIKNRLFDVILLNAELLNKKIADFLTEYFAIHPECGLAIVNSETDVTKLKSNLRKQLIFFGDKPLDKDSFYQIIKKGQDFRQRLLHLIHNAKNYNNHQNNKVVGITKNIRNLNDFIKFITKSTHTPCLIYGEEGTEKLEVVKMIHGKTEDEYTQMRTVNCAKLSEDELLEKLFGVEHENAKGKENRRGEIEIAEDGTLVLENIEKLPEKLQLRLLAFIDTHKFRRHGSNKEFEIRIRLVATTSSNLEKLMSYGDFSRELYYHLTAFEITLPPLRHRAKDILFLAQHYISESNHKFGHHVVELSPEAEQKFMTYHWYGNVDELRLIIERIVLLKKAGNITLNDLPSDVLENKSPQMESEILGNCTLKDLEKIHIEKTLLRTKGNKSRAAEILNISRTTLREKMRTFELVKN